MLVLNIFPPEHKKEANKIVYLDTLSKSQLLSYWKGSISYPDRYVVALVASTKEKESEIPAKDLKTLGQYCDEHNISISESAYHKFATRVAERYRELHGVNPRKVSRTNDSGKWNNKSWAYWVTDFPMIEECLLGFEHSRKPKIPVT